MRRMNISDREIFSMARKLTFRWHVFRWVILCISIAALYAAYFGVRGNAPMIFHQIPQYLYIVLGVGGIAYLFWYWDGSVELRLLNALIVKYKNK